MAIVNISEDAKQHEFCKLVGRACLDRALTVAKKGDMDYLVSTFCGGNLIVETKKDKRRKGFTWQQRLMLRHEADADQRVSAEMKTPAVRGYFSAELDH